MSFIQLAKVNNAVAEYNKLNQEEKEEFGIRINTTIPNPIMIRRVIQDKGNEFYELLGLTSKNLQYIAGELMMGNEEYILRLLREYQPRTQGADHILKHGFTQNQLSFLSGVNQEIKLTKHWKITKDEGDAHIG